MKKKLIMFTAGVCLHFLTKQLVCHAIRFMGTFGISCASLCTVHINSNKSCSFPLHHYLWDPAEVVTWICELGVRMPVNKVRVFPSSSSSSLLSSFCPLPLLVSFSSLIFFFSSWFLSILMVKDITKAVSWYVYACVCFFSIYRYKISSVFLFCSSKIYYFIWWSYSIWYNYFQNLILMYLVVMFMRIRSFWSL